MSMGVIIHAPAKVHGITISAWRLLSVGMDQHTLRKTCDPATFWWTKPGRCQQAKPFRVLSIKRQRAVGSGHPLEVKP